MSTNNHARAVIKVKKTQTVSLLTLAHVIYAAMLADAVRFTAPVPTLVVFLAQITALELAQRAVGTGGKVATAARNVARDVLWVSLQALRSYVQLVTDTGTDDPVLVIKSSGFDIAVVTPRTRPVLDAKQPGLSGLVNLVANASALTGGSKKRPTFHWAYSLDGGHTWVAVPSTPAAKTSVSGLPALTNVSFRVAVTLGVNGTMEPWSQVVTIPVH